MKVDILGPSEIEDLDMVRSAVSNTYTASLPQ